VLGRPLVGPSMVSPVHSRALVTTNERPQAIAGIGAQDVSAVDQAAQETAALSV
jgi:hypothetical protein